MEDNKQLIKMPQQKPRQKARCKYDDNACVNKSGRSEMAHEMAQNMQRPILALSINLRFSHLRQRSYRMMAGTSYPYLTSLANVCLFVMDNNWIGHQ